MISKKSIFLCLLVYFVGLWIFFKSQFVTYEPIKGYSTNKLVQKIDQKLIDKIDQRITNKTNKINNDVTQQSTQYQNGQKLIPQQNPQVTQVVLIIIDALRYSYLSRLKFLSTTLQNHPSTSLLKKSIANQPTMTTQRLQAIMTGSQLFSSTKILDMFLAKQTAMDNLIMAMNREEKTVAVFGDDTWVKLFGLKQREEWTCDGTFNIRDYDSCDNTIYQHLQKVILRQTPLKKTSPTKSSAPYSLLIAHFLSIDHIGHSTSSLTSPQIQKQFNKMSLYFDYLINVAKNDTMFIITGDHGMRQDGNHGGGSKDEKETLFFAYYKGQQKEKNDFKTRIKGWENTQIQQVDITPTLALLLNIPNPINSIGYPILQILPQKYTSYLPIIQHNILLQYQSLIHHYSPQNKLCNILIKKSLSSSLVSRQFHQFLEQKQFIKKEIQQSKCLMDRLRMTQPEQVQICLGVLIMATGFLMLIVLIAKQEIHKLINNQSFIMKTDKTQIIVSWIYQISLQHSAWLLSLFTVYFSWYLIRNQSTYILLLICMIVIFYPSSLLNSISGLATIRKKLKLLVLRKKLLLITLLILITQLQPQKINQYQLNMLNLQIIQNLNSIIKPYLSLQQKQQSQKIPFLSFIIANLWFWSKLISHLYLAKHLRILSSKYKYNKNYHQYLIGVKYRTWMEFGIFSVVYFNFVLSATLFGKHNNTWIYGLRWLIVAIIIIYYMKYCHEKQLSNNPPQNKIPQTSSLLKYPTQFITFSFFSILFQPSQLLILILFISIINLSLQLFPSNTILISLISQYVWWILGNRYQYSSIDIRKSYLFGQQFIAWRNAFVMAIWIVATQIIALAIFNHHHQVYNIKIQAHNVIEHQTQRFIPRQQQRKEISIKQSQISIKQSYKSIKQSQISIKQCQDEDRLENKQKEIGLQKIQEIIKFILIPLCSLISAAVNLTINNGQILFTIVYVPLMILGMLKLAIIVLIVIILLVLKY